jgi:C4-dicarboxylate transporter DctM subunit
MFATLLIILLILLCAGVPVAYSLAGTGLVGFAWYLGIDALVSIPKLQYDSVNHFVLTAVPMFILMSQFLGEGGIGKRMYDMAQVWLRHLHGGLGLATILSCAVLAAVTGSSTAIVAAIGTVAMPELLKRGYSAKVATGAIAAGATLGILIPPSIPLIIYSSVTDESTGELFTAGIIPGLLLTALFSIYLVLHSRRQGVEILPKASMAERWQVTKDAFWALTLPVIVLGLIYMGWATPTEAAALGAAASAVIALFIYRTISIQQLPGLLMKAAGTSVMILAIVQGAIVFGNIATSLRVPQQIVEYIATTNVTPIFFVIAVNLLFVFMGMFLEVIAILLISLPTLLPTMEHLEINMIWFAIVMMINMELALVTPPVGMNLYVMGGVTRSLGLKVDQTSIIRGVTPYMVIMVLFMVALLAFPSIATWLPSLSSVYAK